MIEIGFASPRIDVMMLRPAARTSHISLCCAASVSFTTAFGNPSDAIVSSSASSRSASGAGSSPANSTSSSEPGSPRTYFSRMGANAAILRDSSIIVRSTSSTATGSSATSASVERIASANVGKWHTPSAFARGSGCSARSISVKNASVPSEPTSSFAMLKSPSGRTVWIA